MVTTGYTDTFNRTVSGGLGVATSGQTYTLGGVASQFSVTPSAASIAVASAGDKIGYIDLQSQSADITVQVSMNAIPTTNLATVGLIGKLSTTANYYSGTMMVATGGAISLRFSKTIASGLSTISTTATGLTYVANAVYNLRYQIYWSKALQTNVMSLKLWASGTTEPGGWMAIANDASLTEFTSGTQFGILGRDESSVLGTITTKHQNLAAVSYHLPVPASADPMCADPAFAFPKQTAIESLADATDAALATLDPLADLAILFPRVRVSNSLLSINTATISALPFAATEFNIDTDTNLGYDFTALYLPVGIWSCHFEIQMQEAASNGIQLNFFGNAPLVSRVAIGMRSNPVQLNDQGVGGTAHMSTLVISSDPTSPVRLGVLFTTSLSTTYIVQYMALTAFKISDYFA
jgi:hypothetical protein